MEALGARANDPNTLAGQNVSEINQMRERLTGQNREIRDMQSVNFLDNPISWFFNQMNLPGKIEAYNRDVDLLNLANTDLSNRVQQVKDNATMQVAGIPTITSEMAAATKQVLAGQAKIDENTSIANAAAHNIDNASKAFSILAQSTSAEASMSSAQMDAAWKHVASYNENIKWQASESERKLAQEKLAMQLDDLEAAKKVVPIAAATFGWTDPNIQQLYIRNWDKMPMDMKMDFYAAVTGKVSNNPYNAWETWQKVGNPNSDLPIRTTIDRIGSVVAEVQMLAKDPTKPLGQKLANVKGNTPEYRNIISQEVNTRFESMMALPDNSAMLRVPAPSSVFSRFPQLAATPIGQHIAALAQPGINPTQQQVVTMAIQNMRAAGIPEGDIANNIAAYNKAAVALRNETVDFRKVGVNSAQLQNYQMQLPSGGFTNRPQTVDVTNPVAVQRYMLETRRNDASLGGLARNVKTNLQGTQVQLPFSSLSPLGAIPEAVYRATSGNPDMGGVPGAADSALRGMDTLNRNRTSSMQVADQEFQQVMGNRNAGTPGASR